MVHISRMESKITSHPQYAISSFSSRYHRALLATAWLRTGDPATSDGFSECLRLPQGLSLNIIHSKTWPAGSQPAQHLTSATLSLTHESSLRDTEPAGQHSHPRGTTIPVGMRRADAWDEPMMNRCNTQGSRQPRLWDDPRHIGQVVGEKKRPMQMKSRQTDMR